MGKLFGTDGVRGRAGEYPLDPSTVFRLGRALVQSGRLSALIGRDTRWSGLWIERVLQESIQAEGGEARLAGVITTPGVSYLTSKSGVDVGIVISASHNPAGDNGIKLFSSRGQKLSDEEQGEIESRVLADPAPQTVPFQPDAPDVGQLLHFDRDLVRQYVQFLGNDAGGSLEGLQVVLDCAHGAGFHVAPRVFRDLGAELQVLNDTPDGDNINLQCGAVAPMGLSAEVVRRQACLGCALDGDGDRAILSDDRGRILDGDAVLYILARYLRRRKGVGSGRIVTTVMANLGLERALKREGLEVVRTPVGDRFVLEEMLRGGHSLGGEPAGHILCPELGIAGDGIMVAVRISQIVRAEKTSLAEMARGLKRVPQVVHNQRVEKKVDFASVPEIQGEINRVQKKLKRGRVLIRYSGTEPVVRIMLEGDDQVELDSLASQLGLVFRQHLGSEPNH